MTACNDCWDEAFRRSRIGGAGQAEHYEALLLIPPAERHWCAFARTLTEPPPVDEWCRREDCEHRHWRSGSMPTHRRGTDCPPPLTPADPHGHDWADLGTPGLHGSICRLCGETQID